MTHEEKQYKRAYYASKTKKQRSIEVCVLLDLILEELRRQRR